MNTLFLLAFMVCALGAAVNVVLYVKVKPTAVSMGGAIFCGLLAAWNLVMAVAS